MIKLLLTKPTSPFQAKLEGPARKEYEQSLIIPIAYKDVSDSEIEKLKLQKALRLKNEDRNKENDDAPIMYVLVPGTLTGRLGKEGKMTASKNGVEQRFTFIYVHPEKFPSSDLHNKLKRYGWKFYKS